MHTQARHEAEGSVAQLGGTLRALLGYAQVTIGVINFSTDEVRRASDREVPIETLCTNPTLDALPERGEVTVTQGDCLKYELTLMHLPCPELEN